MMEDRLYLVRFAYGSITGLYCSSLIWQGEARRRTTVSRQTLRLIHGVIPGCSGRWCERARCMQGIESRPGS